MRQRITIGPGGTERPANGGVLVPDRRYRPAEAGPALYATWLFRLGLAALVVPTLFNLARLSWSTEAGAHGPIVLATGLWLIWRDRTILAEARATRGWWGLLPFVVTLPAYCVGRITGILAIEGAALYLILFNVAYLRFGPHVLRRIWFPCLYFLFLLTPPENWMFVATRPIKMVISDTAVDFLSMFGRAIGSTGVSIQIDGYELLVATACSGINSMIGITALGLFYVHIRHGDMPRYAALLTVLVIPLAIIANFIRILLLILITHWSGDAAAQGLAHEATGMGIFMLAMVLLIALDSVLYRTVGRWIERHGRHA
jgi:exosortase